MGRVSSRVSNRFSNNENQGYFSEYSISARIGKHYCPYCNNLLKIKRKKQIFHFNSEEARSFNYYPLGGGRFEYAEFNWDVFYCEICNLEISIRDMRSYEHELKKTGGNIDFNSIRERNESRDKEKNKKSSWLSFLLLCLVVTVVVLVIIAITHL